MVHKNGVVAFSFSSFFFDVFRNTQNALPCSSRVYLQKECGFEKSRVVTPPPPRRRRRQRRRRRRHNMSSLLSTLRLYRQILKATKRFPSKNKDGLYAEIQREFREHRHLEEKGKIEEKRAIAIDGLDRLRAFSGLDERNNEWNVRLKGPSTEESR